MKKWISKSECTRKIEWDRFILKNLTFWSRSRVHLVKAFFIFFFFFFFKIIFLQPVQTGSGSQVGPGQTGVVEDDVIHDVMRRGHVSALGASSQGLGVVARETAPRMPRRVEARGLSSVPEIFGSCRSKAAEDQGIVSFQKLCADLHSFEGLSRWSSRICGGAWWLRC